MGYLLAFAFLAGSFTTAAAWLWSHDLALSLLLAPTGGVVVALAVAFLAPALLEKPRPQGRACRW